MRCEKSQRRHSGTRAPPPPPTPPLSAARPAQVSCIPLCSSSALLQSRGCALPAEVGRTARLTLMRLSADAARAAAAVSDAARKASRSCWTSLDVLCVGTTWIGSRWGASHLLRGLWTYSLEALVDVRPMWPWLWGLMVAEYRFFCCSGTCWFLLWRGPGGWWIVADFWWVYRGDTSWFNFDVSLVAGWSGCRWGFLQSLQRHLSIAGGLCFSRDTCWLFLCNVSLLWTAGSLNLLRRHLLAFFIRIVPRVRYQSQLVEHFIITPSLYKVTLWIIWRVNNAQMWLELFDRIVYSTTIVPRQLTRILAVYRIPRGLNRKNQSPLLDSQNCQLSPCENCATLFTLSPHFDAVYISNNYTALPHLPRFQQPSMRPYLLNSLASPESTGISPINTASIPKNIRTSCSPDSGWQIARTSATLCSKRLTYHSPITINRYTCVARSPQITGWPSLNPTSRSFKFTAPHLYHLYIHRAPWRTSHGTLQADACTPGLQSAGPGVFWSWRRARAGYCTLGPLRVGWLYKIQSGVLHTGPAEFIHKYQSAGVPHLERL